MNALCITDMATARLSARARKGHSGAYSGSSPSNDGQGVKFAAGEHPQGLDGHDYLSGTASKSARA